MKRPFARSRSLALAAALTAVAAIAAGYSAHAASLGSGAGAIRVAAYQAPFASDTPCSITYQTTTCQSTDPTVTAYNDFYGDQVGCSYVSAVNWGDGQSTTNVQYDDPGDGEDLLGMHTYADAGTYTISVTLEVTAGDCTANGYTAQFTLVPLLPAAPSGLTATAIDPNDIKLTWQDNSSNETGFEINNGVVNNYAGANSTTYTWGALAPDTYMCFRIRAYNSAGDSAWDPSTSPGYVCTTTPLSPRISLNRTSGPPGAHVTATGTGWAPGGAVHVQLPSRFYGSTSWHVNSGGGWRQTFTVGDATAGKYTLRFGETSGNLLVTGSFKVLVAATLKGRTWDGYMVDYGQKYTSVTATWTEPQYPLNGLAAFWVGLGTNDSNSHLQQIGTAVGIGMTFKKGKQTSPYFAWYETVPDKPDHPALIEKPVNPGDKLRASVTYSRGSYTLKLTDITGRWTATEVIHQTYDTDSTEVVMESPGVNWPDGLSPVTFSGIKVNGASVQNPTAVIGKPASSDYVGPFKNGSFTAYPGQ